MNPTVEKKMKKMIDFEKDFDKEFNNEFGTPDWCCAGDFCSVSDHVQEANDIKSFIRSKLQEQIEEDNKRFLGYIGEDEKSLSQITGQPMRIECFDTPIRREARNQLRQELRDKVKGK